MKAALRPLTSTGRYLKSRPSLLGITAGVASIAILGYLFGSTYTFTAEASTARVSRATDVAMRASRPDDHSEESAANRKLQFALIQAGLTADVLTAAGCSSTQTTNLVASARTWMGSNSTALETASNSLRTAKLAAAPLEKLRERGLATTEQLPQLATNLQSVASASASVESLLSDLRTAAVTGLTEQQIANLSMLRDRAAFPSPIALRLGNRTDGDALALRNIASNQRIAARIGENFVGEEGSTSFSETDAAIMATYAEQLPYVSQAWANAIGSID